MRLLPADKVLHLAAGAALVLVGLPAGWAAALALCALGAFAREFYALHKGQRFDWLDITATLAGGVAMLLLARLFI